MVPLYSIVSSTVQKLFSFMRSNLSLIWLDSTQMIPIQKVLSYTYALYGTAHVFV